MRRIRLRQLRAGLPERQSGNLSRRRAGSTALHAATPRRRLGPPCCAKRANFTTRFGDGTRNANIPRSAALSMLVRIVTPRSLGRCGLGSLEYLEHRLRLASFPGRRECARSAVAPPARRQLLKQHPLRYSGCRGILGRGRYPGQLLVACRTAEGPSAVNKCIFILNMQLAPPVFELIESRLEEGKSSATISF